MSNKAPKTLKMVIFRIDLLLIGGCDAVVDAASVPATVSTTS